MNRIKEQMMAGLLASTILAGTILAGGTQLTYEGKTIFESEAKVSFGATYGERAVKAVVNAKEEGNAIPWLKEKYPQFHDLIIAEEFNLRIGDTDYGMYLRAMKLKSKKQDWVPSMIKAAKYGSEEAMEELKPLMHKVEIKKAVEQLFGVEVAKVNTMNCNGRTKRVGRYVGKTSDWKKAIITLTEGSKAIEFFEGMV